MVIDFRADRRGANEAGGDEGGNYNAGCASPKQQSFEPQARLGAGSMTASQANRRTGTALMRADLRRLLRRAGQNPTPLLPGKSVTTDSPRRNPRAYGAGFRIASKWARPSIGSVGLTSAIAASVGAMSAIVDR
jgi:hypothetical protein